MTDREIMQQALEALTAYDGTNGEGKRKRVLATLRERLAQPEQAYWNAVEGWVKIDEVREHFDSVGCGVIYKTAGEDRTPLYTTPPQRKPLTPDQVFAIADQHPVEGFDPEIMAFARAIEAAHGIGEKK